MKFGPVGGRLYCILDNRLRLHIHPIIFLTLHFFCLIKSILLLIKGAYHYFDLQNW